MIIECRSSGYSDKNWCQDHNIALSTFYYQPDYNELIYHNRSENTDSKITIIIIACDGNYDDACCSPSACIKKVVNW